MEEYEYRDFQSLNDMEREIITTGHVKEIEKYEKLLMMTPKDFSKKEMPMPLRMRMSRKAWKVLITAIGVLVSVGFILLGIEIILSDTMLSVIGMLMVFGSWLPILIIGEFVSGMYKPLPTFVLKPTAQYPLSTVPLNETITCSKCNGSGITGTIHHEGHWRTWQRPVYGSATETEPVTEWVEPYDEGISCADCKGFGTFKYGRAWIEELNRRIINLDSKIDEINRRVNQVNELLNDKNKRIQEWNN